MPRIDPHRLAHPILDHRETPVSSPLAKLMQQQHALSELNFAKIDASRLQRRLGYVKQELDRGLPPLTEEEKLAATGGVTERHLQAIKLACVYGGMGVFVRPAGISTVQLLNEVPSIGTKGQNIPDKSLKKEVIERIYGTHKSAVMQQLERHGLLGIVPKWQNNKIAGFYIKSSAYQNWTAVADENDPRRRASDDIKLTDNGEPYFPLQIDPDNPKILDDSLRRLSFDGDPRKNFVTGDYDLLATELAPEKRIPC